VTPDPGADVGRASDAADPTTREQADGVARFAYELGVLKRMRRSGWWHAGVRDPESVAEHTARVAQLAALIAAEEGADPARASFMALWHDSQETRTGDIPHTAKPYLSRPANEAITADQTAHLPQAAAKTVQEAVAEYEAQNSLESWCAKDADKLECLIQALEYRSSGYVDVTPWITSSRSALRTSTAQRIADAAATISPLSWRE
jgi:putative hydrolase of HD superfamily